MVSRTAALALLSVACLVVAGSAPVPGAVSEQGPGAADPGTSPVSNYVVTLNDSETRSGTGTVGLDVARSISTQRSDAQLGMETMALQERLEAAESDEERFEILRDALDGIDVRLSALYAAERDAIGAFHQDEITAREYLYRSAFIQARTSEYMEMVTIIETEGEQIQAAAIGRDVDEVRTRAAIIGGPVQDRIVSAYRGEIATETVRVEAGPDGYVAVAIVSDRAVRQSHRYDLRAEEGPTQDRLTTLDYVNSQYPDETDGSPSIGIDGHRSSGVFYVTIAGGSNGEVTSYVDNRNLTIFKEVYRQPLERLPVADTTARRGEGIDIFVDRVPSYGLLGVQTNDPASGEQIDAEILVNGSVVGSTREDGRLWLVDPPGPTNVTARADPNRSVSTSVTAGD